MKKESRLIEQIRSGDNDALEQLYIKCRAEFLAYSARFAVNAEDAVDIYQDSVVVLYENIRSGKLAVLTSSLKTYLFAVGKYKILNSLKMKSVMTTNTDTDLDSFLPAEVPDDPHLEETNILKMQEAFRSLGIKCQDVIRLFYYENLSIGEIKERLGYASKDVVKSQKSRCIRQIKEILSKEWTGQI